MSTDNSSTINNTLSPAEEDVSNNEKISWVLRAQLADIYTFILTPQPSDEQIASFTRHLKFILSDWDLSECSNLSGHHRKIIHTVIDWLGTTYIQKYPDVRAIVDAFFDKVERVNR